MSESAKRRAGTEKFRSQILGYWKPFCSREDLERDYVTNGMSQDEIAVKHGVTTKRVATSMRRYSIVSRPQVPRDQSGSKNGAWKGDQATYKAFHLRLKKLYGQPKECWQRGASGDGRSYDWASLTKNWADPTDYMRLCRSCHWKLDRHIGNLGKYAQKKEVPGVA